MLSDETKEMLKSYKAWGLKNLWVESMKEYIGFPI